MITDKGRIFDGWLSLEGGVDAGREPDTVDINQVRSATNMTFRGGTATTRPGFRKLEEEFPFITKQVWCFNHAHRYNDPTQEFIAGEYKPNNIGLDIIGNCTFATGGSGDITVNAFHSLRKGDRVKFTTTGTLPTLPPPTNDDDSYFVLQDGLTGNKLRISLTDGGAKITFTTAGTGIHTLRAAGGIAPWFLFENSEYIYRNGILQCSLAFSPHNGDDCIMAMIGGRLFKIIPRVTTAKVSEVVIEGEGKDLRNMKRFPLAYVVQADKWLIAQDGVSSAIIYDGQKARRSDTTGTAEQTEVPVGTIMAYGMGRIVVVVNDRDIAFGDLHGSHALPDPSDSLILFTERNFLAEGFDAAIPSTQGKPTGMMFFPQQDTSTGNGQLIVFAERGATNFFLSLERSLWKTSSFQILSLLTTGLRGHRSISVVNEDLWFRADDGVRSYRQARSEPSGWPHIPLSTPVRQFMDKETSFTLKFCSSMYFDNRIIFTISPAWTNGRPIHWAMVVVDFDIISSFSGTAQTPQASKPAWDGQWTLKGNFPIQLLTGTFEGVTRAFMFTMDNENGNVNQLYELTMDDKDDWDGRKIEWELVSRSFDFQKLSPQSSTPFTENELYDADLWLREIIE